MISLPTGLPFRQGQASLLHAIGVFLVLILVLSLPCSTLAAPDSTSHPLIRTTKQSFIGDIALPSPPSTVRPRPFVKPADEEAQPLKIPSEKANKLPLTEILDFADRYNHGLWLDVGSPAFALHTRPGEWTEAEFAPFNRSTQRLRKNSATIRCFLPEADTYVVSLHARVDRSGETFSIETSGKSPVSVALDKEGWSSYWLDLSDWDSISGYREFTLKTSRTQSISIDQVHFHPVTRFHPKPNLAIPPVEPLRQSIFYGPPAPLSPSKSKQEVSLPGEGGLVWHMEVPNAVRLLFSLRIERDIPGQSPVVLLVRAANADAKPDLLFVEPFAYPSNARNHTYAVDLTKYAGRLVRLEIWTTGGTDSDRLTLIDPRIETYLPVRPPTAWIPPRNVIVFLSDTLRWDKIHFFKPADNDIITPNFDRIASEGITFTNAISQGCWSKPSQAAIMGGRYPWDLRMEKPEQTRADNVLLIADAIKDKRPEVVTASFSSNGYVSSRFGFAQNWDYSRNMIREQLPNRTEYLLSAMTRTWEKNAISEQPFFVWLGTIDPHVAYNPRKPFLDLYDPDPYHGRIVPYKTASLLYEIRTGRFKPSKRDWHHLNALYKGEVTYNDAQFGELMKQLEDWDILDDTALILVSDHGDEFLDHKGMGHGHSLYDELVRVPMIVYYPRGFRQARVIDQTVETMAIYPTVLSMLDIEPKPETTAQSLLPYAFGAAPLWPRVSASTLSRSQTLIALSQWRLLIKQNELRLFDTASDPYQQNELADSRPDVVYYMWKRYMMWKYRYQLS